MRKWRSFSVPVLLAAMSGCAMEIADSEEIASAQMAAEGAAAKFLGNIWPGNKVTVAEAKLDPLFNQLTVESGGMWRWVEATNNSFWWGVLDPFYAHCDSTGRACTHAHFYWAGVNGNDLQVNPSWVTSSNVDAESKDFISKYMARFGEKVDYAKVVNEPLHHTPRWVSGLGGTADYKWVERGFEIARMHTGNTKLLLNDFSVLLENETMNEMISLANQLKAKGLIDGIGCQGHGLENVTAAAARARLDTIASQTGLPIYITEFDVNLSNDTQQRDVFERLFPVFWEHPAVHGVTLWGLHQGTLWLPNTHLITSGGADRPALTWLRGYMASRAPTMASKPRPAHCSTGRLTSGVTLKWNQGAGSTSRDVYLGTTAALTASDRVATGITGVTHNTGALANNTTYFWRVDERNGSGTTAGSVYSFATGTAEGCPDSGGTGGTGDPGTGGTGTGGTGTGGTGTGGTGTGGTGTGGTGTGDPGTSGSSGAGSGGESPTSRTAESEYQVYAGEPVGCACRAASSGSGGSGYAAFIAFAAACALRRRRGAA
jgi:endo-1,4-beta-xylanase